MTLNFNNWQNILLHQGNLIFLVDEVNSNCSFGYTNKKSHIRYNLKILNELKFVDKKNYDTQLSNSKEGLTSVFPLGRYIVILKMKKDKSSMEMLFLDFRIGYADVDKSLNGTFSEKLITKFKGIKYYMEEWFDETWDLVQLKRN